MPISRRSLMIGAGIALISASVLLRVAFGATLSQATTGGPVVTLVWAGTIGLFLVGLYALVVAGKSRRPGGGDAGRGAT